MAQLVARVVWDHQAAGSNPVTRTKFSGFDRKIKAARVTLRLFVPYIAVAKRRNKMLGNVNPDGKQNEVLALPARGHIVVLGTAGSGKTTMALLRAVGLSNLPNSPNVLVVTFNGALVQYMEKIINGHLTNITIENFHKFARGYLNSRSKMPPYNGILHPKLKKKIYRTGSFYCEG